MALDLTRLRPPLNELLLRDEVQLLRAPAGDPEDVPGEITIDPVTGSVINVPSDLQVWSGLAGIRQVYRGTTVEEGGRNIALTEYEIKLPGGGEVEPNEADLILVLDCLHDPGLVGKYLRINDVIYGTLIVFKKVRAELREDLSDRP